MRAGTLRAIVLGMLAAGCGSKTGADVPDARVDSGLDAGVPCIEVPFDAGVVDLPLEVELGLERADVVILVDVTGSMGGEIGEIRQRLRDRIVPAVRGAIPDARFAVASFADFPIAPYGSDGDLPFQLLLPLSADVARVQAAVNRLRLQAGGDGPESQVEALYQLATGEGFAPWVPPAPGCPAAGRGYACLRTDALPIVLLVTDAPFHNGPGGAEPYTRVRPAPHRYEEARDALRALGARVIGLNSGDPDAAAHLRVLARDTGAVDGRGQPIVFDIGPDGERLGTRVVDAMRSFAAGLVLDVDAVLADPDPLDGVDVLAFIESIEPLEARPPDGVDSIDFEAGVFRGVRSGTVVVFRLRVRNDVTVPGPMARRFRVEVTFRGDGRVRLGRRIVEIVVPGADGSGCD
ncbi:MAG: VWA domain-containing protein [Myxococcota bacterium]|nr:VWA domain-containing protein [Myxococcota bacterium]MDW8361813.1 vWA domain-containing protein [Myxococcales bacterium]